MTKLECMRRLCRESDIKNYICTSEVTKDQLETIIDGWLVLDDGQWEMYPDANTLYARIMSLDIIWYFSASKRINDDRLEFCFILPDGNYRYYVKED